MRYIYEYRYELTIIPCERLYLRLEGAPLERTGFEWHSSRIHALFIPYCFSWILSDQQWNRSMI